MLVGKVETCANWEEILQEYSDLIRTDKSQSIFDCLKKLTKTNWQIVYVHHCCLYLKNIWDAEIAESLQMLGYNYVENMNDRSAYLKQVYAIEMEAKFLIVLMNQYRAEYKVLASGTNEGKGELNMADYDKEIAILSRFVGFWIEKYKITVSEFSGIVNLYLDNERRVALQ